MSSGTVVSEDGRRACGFVELTLRFEEVGTIRCFRKDLGGRRR